MPIPIRDSSRSTFGEVTSCNKRSGLLVYIKKILVFRVASRKKGAEDVLAALAALKDAYYLDAIVRFGHVMTGTPTPRHGVA